MTLEEKARKQDYCPVCAKDKEKNAITCWDCFKHTKEIVPLKYTDLSIEDWLSKHAKKWQVII